MTTHRPPRTDNAIKNRYYSTMRRMQRQSLRKKAPMREGKSIRVATVNASPLAAASRAVEEAPPTPQQSPYETPKLFSNSPEHRERVRLVRRRVRLSLVTTVD